MSRGIHTSFTSDIAISQTEDVYISTVTREVCMWQQHGLARRVPRTPHHAVQVHVIQCQLSNRREWAKNFNFAHRPCAVHHLPWKGGSVWWNVGNVIEPVQTPIKRLICKEDN